VQVHVYKLFSINKILEQTGKHYYKKSNFDLQLTIEYVEYDIKKFNESCCGELPTTKSPSLFAVEGVFKGFEKINEYISLKRDAVGSNIESESAYW
jgi:hypothetical protein